MRAHGHLPRSPRAIRSHPDEPDQRGRFGAALLFVRWSEGGERPVGHLETEVLVWGKTKEEAADRLKGLSLFDVKAALDDAISQAPGEW